MEIVYIEDIFFIEFLTNILLFFCVTALMRRKTAKLRLFFTAVIGAAFSFFAPSGLYSLFLYKIITLPVLTFLLYKYNSFKEYAFTALIIIAVTNLTAICAYNLTKLPFFAKISERFSYIFVLATLLVFSMTARKLVKLFIRNRSKKTFVYDLAFETNGKTCEAKGYFDSGNRLIASGGEPVVVIDKDFKELTDIKPTGEQIIITTAAGKMVKSLYEIEKMTMTANDKKRQFSHIKAIVSSEKLKGYDVILNCDTAIE